MQLTRHSCNPIGIELFLVHVNIKVKKEHIINLKSNKTRRLMGIGFE